MARIWKSKNVGACVAYKALRKARKKNAVRGCQERVARIYKRCAELRKWFDVQVDHIIPLSFGGAHSAKNLQVIYAFENRRKHSNPFYVPRVVFQ